jgi:hypothetical protein
VPLIEQMRHYGQEWLMNGNGDAGEVAAATGARHTKPIASEPVPSGVGAGRTT